MRLTDAQIEVINNWLTEAYNSGYNAGLSEHNETQDTVAPVVVNNIPDISSFQPTPNYDELCA